jgi:hypothetical protein
MQFSKRHISCIRKTTVESEPVKDLMQLKEDLSVVQLDGD